MHVTYGLGSVLLQWHCDVLCSSSLLDGAIFAHNEQYGGMSIPLQRVVSLRHRMEANAAAASHWLCRALGNIRHED